MFKVFVWCSPPHPTKRRSNSVAKHTKNPRAGSPIPFRPSIPSRVIPANSHFHQAEMPQGCDKHRPPATRNTSADVLLTFGLVFVARSPSHIRAIVCSIFTSLEAQNCRWKDRRPPSLETCQSNLCPHGQCSICGVRPLPKRVFPLSRKLFHNFAEPKKRNQWCLRS